MADLMNETTSGTFVLSGAMSQPSTIDEPICETITRDLLQVYNKLKVVLVFSVRGSFNYEFCKRGENTGNENDTSKDEILKSLKHWDLWGPLLVCLFLSILLSINSPADQSALVFSSVFFIFFIGASIVTINAQLLGASLSFFQSVCVLGYCVFPLSLASLVINMLSWFNVDLLVVNILIVFVTFLWSTKASVLFIGQFIREEKKSLAVFPVFFFYTFLSWMILL